MIKSIKTKHILIAVLTAILAICATVFAVSQIQNKKQVSADATVSFSGLVAWNNDLTLVSGYSCNYLSFSGTFNGGTADTTNQASANTYSIANGLKINGVSMYELYQGDAITSIQYNLGATFIMVRFPVSALTTTAEYPTATLTIDAGTTFFEQTLPAVELKLVNGAWALPLSFSAITWNNIDFTGDATHYAAYGETTYTPANGKLLLATFTGGTITAEKDYTNLATSSYDIGNKLKIDGVPIYQISGAHVDYALTNSLHMFIYVPNSALTAGRAILTIDEGTVYKGAYLTATTIYYYSGDNWTTTDKARDFTFSTITWNGLSYYDGYSDYLSTTGNGVLLTFAGATATDYLSLVANEFNGNIKDTNFATTSIGDHIKLNGVALSSISGVEICYFSINNLWIYVPNMSTTVTTEYRHPTLTIDEDARFMDALLPSLTLYYLGEWSTTNPAVTPTAVTFDHIEWNNIKFYDNYFGNGVLLSYSANLSTFLIEYNGGIKDVNWVDSSVGDHIKLNGVALSSITGAQICYFNLTNLWIYAPNMTTATTLLYAKPTITIDANTEFLDAKLPLLSLVFNSTTNLWETKYTVTSIVGSTFYHTYHDMSVITTLGDAYYEDLFSSETVAKKMVQFTIGDSVYKAGETAQVQGPIGVTVTAIGFDTVNGASVRLSNPSGIRFQTNISYADYNTLVSTYGVNNIELGTYIVPASYLGANSLRTYFANNEAVVAGVTKYVKIVNEGFANEATASTDGYYSYCGSLVDLLDYNYATKFLGIGYIKVTDGANVYTVFGGYVNADHIRSIYEVSRAAYGDYTVGSANSNILKGYLDGVIEVNVDATDTVTVGGAAITDYTIPYSLSYDGGTEAYTVTSTTAIKSLMINGEKVSFDTDDLTINGSIYSLDFVFESGDLVVKKKVS